MHERLADVIAVKGMQFFGYHGVYEEEQRLGQRFVVNVWLYLDLKRAGMTRNVDDTVDYGLAYQVVRRIVEGEPIPLIESLAEEISTQLLGAFARLLGVEVEVEKPGAPMAGVFDTVSVRIQRWRRES